MDVAANAGADDVVALEDGVVEVQTPPEQFHVVQQALADAGFDASDAELTYRASTLNELDEETAEKVLKLIDALDELDDVQNVHANADFPE